MNTAKFSLYIQYNNVVSRTTCGIMCSVYPINRIYLMCINALYNVCPQTVFIRIPGQIFQLRVFIRKCIGI